MNKFEKTREWLRKSGSKRAVVKYDKSRRRFISASAAVISGYAVGSAGMGVLNKDDYEIIHKNIHLNNLPESLKGTTITLVSDIHSGPYMSEEVMKDYVDVINSLNSDLILIPGDMTSTDRNEVKPFTKAFRDLKAEHGIYATLGNHDYLTDPDYISDAISGETPIQMMRNDSSVIEKDGNELCILGMEDTKESMAKDYKVIYSYLDETIKSAKAKSNNYNELPKILLCHKPYFFKGMSRKGIDLILSGHTHGGQVVLVKFGKTNISLASTISNYISGYYSENGSQMYVSRGLGSSALPLRINCRPEITRITLT